MLKILLFCSILFLCFVSNAQYINQFENIILLDLDKSAPVYVIHLKSGSSIVGQVIRKEESQLIVLSKDLGEVKITLDNIDTIQLQDQIKDAAPNQVRKMVGAGHNIFSSTGYNLEKGEANLQFTEIFLFSAGYGISDYFSVMAGMTWIPGVEFSEQAYFIMPKFTLPISSTFSLSAELMPIFVEDETVTLAGVHGSFGSRDKNITVGYMTPIYDGEIGEVGILNLSGTLRVSNKVALLTDNIIPMYGTEFEDGSIISVGTRLIGESGSFDLGFLFISEVEGFPIPFISYTLKL